MTTLLSFASLLVPAAPSGQERFFDPRRSGFSPLRQPPLVADRIDKPTFTREMVVLNWRAGDPVYLFIVKPKRVARPRPVVTVYSYPSSPQRFQDDRWCERATAGGVAVAGFESALTGDRYKGRAMREWFVSELDEAIGATVHDVTLVIDYLATRPDLDTSRVGFFGLGSGAAVGIVAAAVDPRIKALYAFAPWADWPTWMRKSTLVPEAERPRYLASKFQRRVAPLDPVRWLPKVRSAAVRLVLVGGTKLNPLDAQNRLRAVAPPQSTVAAYPSMAAAVAALSEGRLFSWIAERLRA